MKKKPVNWNNLSLAISLGYLYLSKKKMENFYCFFFAFHLASLPRRSFRVTVTCKVSGFSLFGKGKTLDRKELVAMQQYSQWALVLSQVCYILIQNHIQLWASKHRQLLNQTRPIRIPHSTMH